MKRTQQKWNDGIDVNYVVGNTATRFAEEKPSKQQQPKNPGHNKINHMDDIVQHHNFPPYRINHSSLLAKIIMPKATSPTKSEGTNIPFKKDA